MKIPWDKEYLKISFHVILTLIAIYVLIFLFTNSIAILDILIRIFKQILVLLTPLIIGFVASYLLDPVVDFFDIKFDKFSKKHNFKNAKQDDTTKEKPQFSSRTAGTAITYIILLLVIGLLMWLGMKQLGGTDVSLIIKAVNDGIKDFAHTLTSMSAKIQNTEYIGDVDTYIDSIFNSIVTAVNITGANIVNIISQTSGFIVNLIMGLTIAFYFLKDKSKIKYYILQIMDTFLPQKINTDIRNLGEDTDYIFSGYIRGQTLDAGIMTVLIGITLKIIGMKYAFIIAIISGVSNFIPYFGSIMAFFLVILVGLIADGITKTIMAAIAMIVLQQIDGAFIVPKVVGENVELHPVLVLLALSISASLFGVLGMIFAVPIVAIIKLIIIRFYKRKRGEL